MVFFTLFKLYKWYQIAQRTTDVWRRLLFTWNRVKTTKLSPKWLTSFFGTFSSDLMEFMVDSRGSQKNTFLKKLRRSRRFWYVHFFEGVFLLECFWFLSHELLGTNGLVKSLRICQKSSILFDFCRQLRGHIGSKIYWISFRFGIFA